MNDSTGCGVSGNMKAPSHRDRRCRGAGDPMDEDPTQKPFTPEVLDKTVIAIPLLEILRKEGKRKPRALHPIIIDINLEYREGRGAARERITKEIASAIERFGSPGVQQGINAAKT